MADEMLVFDRAGVRRNRERAAAGLERHDFLFREVAERLADRLADVTRRFPLALDLGCRTGLFAGVAGGRGGIEALVQCDLSEAMLRRCGGLRAAADEEALPFAAASFDLIVSVLSLHAVNDLPGALVQARRTLKPDGLFLAALFGGETLRELRTAFLEAEAESTGGASPRIAPFVDVRDAGGLLQRAGFALPVVDSETVTANYAEPLSLMHELRGMGEANVLRERARRPLRRDLLLAAAACYRERFGDRDGRVPASFEIVTLTGWSPSEMQPRPLRPGSARRRLAEALDARERPAGEKADPERR